MRSLTLEVEVILWDVRTLFLFSFSFLFPTSLSTPTVAYIHILQDA